MTIPEHTDTKPTEDGPPLSAAPRLTRPTPERQAPIRNWSTLFGPPQSGGVLGPPQSGGVFGLPQSGGMLGAAPRSGTPLPANGASAGSTPGVAPGPMGQTLSDAVGQGYRVINDYLSQGQRYAEAMRWPDVASALPGNMPNVAGQDPQQMLRRLMQYGADFAGMWFEVWSKMGWPPAGSWPGSAGAAGPLGFAGFGVPAARDVGSPSTEQPRPGAAGERSAAAAEPAAGAAAAGPERFSVSIVSERRVQSVLELRRGSWTTLLVHALRPEGHDAPAIRGVKIEALPEQSTVRVALEVPADQPAGVYNGMIIDAVSNRPRGTLTLSVEPPAGE